MSICPACNRPWDGRIPVPRLPDSVCACCGQPWTDAYILANGNMIGCFEQWERWQLYDREYNVNVHTGEVEMV